MFENGRYFFFKSQSKNSQQVISCGDNTNFHVCLFISVQTDHDKANGITSTLDRFIEI